MRILITGDRNWYCLKLANAVLRRIAARYGQDVVIVHGAASGVDSAFEAAARTLGIKTESHHADWSRLGKSAGPARNAEMVATGADLCLAVHRTFRWSRGTKDCARKAIAAGIPTWVIENEEIEMRQVHEGDV